MKQRTITITISAHDMPEGLHGICTEQALNNYAIHLNSKDTEQQQAASFLHECLHIYHDDINDTRSADQIEADRHRELLQLLKTMLQEEGPAEKETDIAIVSGTFEEEAFNKILVRIGNNQPRWRKVNKDANRNNERYILFQNCRYYETDFQAAQDRAQGKTAEA